MKSVFFELFRHMLKFEKRECSYLITSSLKSSFPIANLVLLKNISNEIKIMNFGDRIYRQNKMTKKTKVENSQILKPL